MHLHHFNILKHVSSQVMIFLKAAPYVLFNNVWACAQTFGTFTSVSIFPDSPKSFLHAALQIRVHIGNLFSSFLTQNIHCGYSKEPSQWDGSVEHPKHVFKLIGKEIITVLHSLNFLIWAYVLVYKKYMYWWIKRHRPNYDLKLLSQNGHL